MGRCGWCGDLDPTNGCWRCNGNDVHLQTYSSTSVRHFWHRTKQHQWNLHRHRSTTTLRRVWKPRPQHISSQPSVPADARLQRRPRVPSDPVLPSCSQKSGDAATKTRSASVGDRKRALRATSSRREPLRCWITSTAPSNLSRNVLPTSRNAGIERQQVFSSHEPETPWHLHCTRMKSSIAYAQQSFTERFTTSDNFSFKSAYLLVY